MTDFTPKKMLDTQNASDAKKIYAHPDVIDLLPVDETQAGKNPAVFEDVPFPAWGAIS